ncbi:MAG: glycosyltransferase family 25 protein, partial [Chloroflexota bacterium]
DLTADARRAQLAYIRPLGAAAASPATAAAPKPAAAPPAAPALLPETWREILAAPAFFINLDRMPERRGLMKRRLAAAGFSDIRRVHGVDGLVPAELGPAWAALGNPSFREGVTPPTDELAGRPGLQGAFTSHGLLWRRIVEEQIPVCTIFEDDARFDPRWADLAPRFHAVTPRDAEVVWMGAFEPGMDLRGIRAESFPIIGLYACIVTLDGARRLLEATVGDPRGVYAFDSMISASQFRFLRDGGPRPMRWSVWTMPDEDAPGFPPFHPWDYPAFGLVHPGVDDSAAQKDQAPIRLLRSIERSHAAGDLAAGRLACDRLRCLHDIEDAMTDHARRNQLFYTEAQDALADGVRRVRIDPGMPPGAVLDPPALVADPNGGAVLVVQGALGDAFHTRWLRLGPDGLPLGPGRPVQSPFAAVRLAPFRDRLIAAGLVPGPMPGDPPRFALAAASASFGASGTDGEAAAAGELGFGQPIAFGEPDPALWRGPWPLAVAGEDVRVLRSFGPAASLRLDPAQGELLPAATHAGPRLAEDLTGSAPLVPFGDGWLAIAREDAAFPGGPPLDRPFSAWSVYQPDVIALHRLAAFDADLRMTRISHPFVFAALGHEACGGLAIIGDRLVMAWDNARDETWLSIMPLAEAERLLIPVENLMLAGRWPAGL